MHSLIRDELVRQFGVGVVTHRPSANGGGSESVWHMFIVIAKFTVTVSEPVCSINDWQ